MDAIFWTVYVRNLDIHFLLTYEAKRFDFKYYVMSKISSWSTFVNHTSMLNVLRSFHHSHIIVRIIYNRNRLFRNQFQPCNIRLNGERVVCIVNHKSRFCLIRFFYIFLLQIINFYFFITTSFGIKSSQTCDPAFHLFLFSQAHENPACLLHGTTSHCLLQIWR